MWIGQTDLGRPKGQPRTRAQGRGRYPVLRRFPLAPGATARQPPSEARPLRRSFGCRERLVRRRIVQPGLRGVVPADVRSGVAVGYRVGRGVFGALPAHAFAVGTGGRECRLQPDVASSQHRAGLKIGGESGIRTHGRFDPSAVFKTAALNHSAISPLFHKTVPRAIHIYTPVGAPPWRWRRDSSWSRAWVSRRARRRAYRTSGGCLRSGWAGVRPGSR
jgi:hypothetical protein